MSITGCERLGAPHTNAIMLSGHKRRLMSVAASASSAAYVLTELSEALPLRLNERPIPLQEVG